MSIANKIEDGLLKFLQLFFYMPTEKHMLQFFVHMLLWLNLSVLNGLLLKKTLLWFILTGFLVVFPIFKELVLDGQWKDLKSKDMRTDLISYYLGMIGMLAYFL